MLSCRATLLQAASQQRATWSGGAKKWFASAQAQPAPQLSPDFGKQKLQSTQLGNGLKLVTCDDGQPLSRVSLFFNAGTRFETPGYRGIVHRIQTCLGSGKRNLSAVRMSFDLASLGALATCSFDREWLQYELTCTRDKMPMALPYFNELACNALYEDWFFDENAEQMEVDIALAEQNYAAALMELVHSAAYSRSTMGNGLLSPVWMMGRHNSVTVEAYLQRNAGAESAVLLSQGVDHGMMVDYASNKLGVKKGARASQTTGAMYTGGERVQECKSPLVHVAIAGEGFSIKDGAMMAAQMVFSNLLDGAEMSSCWGLPRSRFLRPLASKSGHALHGFAFNYFYSDTGLCGVCVATSRQHIADAVKTATGELKALCKGGVDEKRLNGAKCAVKRKLIMDCGRQKYLQTFVPGLLIFGQKTMDLDEFCSAIDKVTAEDVRKVGAKVMQKEMSIAILGDRAVIPSFKESLI